MHHQLCSGFHRKFVLNQKINIYSTKLVPLKFQCWLNPYIYTYTLIKYINKQIIYLKFSQQYFFCKNYSKNKRNLKFKLSFGFLSSRFICKEILFPAGFPLLHIKMSLALFQKWFNFKIMCQKQQKISYTVMSDNQSFVFSSSSNKPHQMPSKGGGQFNQIQTSAKKNHEGIEDSYE